MPLILGTLAPEPAVFRDIENHYHLQSIAENTESLNRFQAATFRLQAGQAQAMSEHNDVVERLLTDVTGGLYGVEMELGQLNQTATATLSELQSLHALVLQCFDRVSAQLMQQQETLSDIRRVLLNP